MDTPLVSISCITYNHAPFIRQCLDGFLMQQCNFPIEIFINDDCSTDGTTEIIREYAEKYPDKIFPIFHEENQWSKGVRCMSQTFIFPRVRGKYIALCEGDDYWTDPLKLQKQVDFLESHPECSLCCHDVGFISYSKSTVNSFFNGDIKTGIYGHGDINIPTCSAVCLSICVKNVPFHPSFRTGDDLIWLTCSMYGKFYYFTDVMACYRHHAGSWSVNAAPQDDATFFAYQLEFYNAAIEVFPPVAHKNIRKKFARVIAARVRNVYRKNPFLTCKMLFVAWRCCFPEFLSIFAEVTNKAWLRKVCNFVGKFC